MRTQAANGAKWFVTFIDDSSRWCEVYFLKTKAGVLDAFKAYKSYAETQLGKQIKSVQSDNGGEYCNQEFDKLLENAGIERRLTVPRTPQQNGVAERMNRTLVDMARCLMLQSGLTPMFWADAVAAACYIRNRCPSSSINDKTPYEKWRGELPDLSNLREFGVPVYVLNKDPTKDKSAERTIKGIFVGYPRETKGYRIWLPNERKQIVARDVKFPEAHQNPVELNTSNENIEIIGYEDSIGADLNRERMESPVSESPIQDIEDTPTSTIEPAQIEVNNNRRGRGRPRLIRTGCRGRPKRLFQPALDREDEDETHVPNINVQNLPVNEFSGAAEFSINEAMCSPEHGEWERQYYPKWKA